MYYLGFKEYIYIKKKVQRKENDSQRQRQNIRSGNQGQGCSVLHQHPYINTLFPPTCSTVILTLSHSQTHTEFKNIERERHGRANLHHDQARWRSKRPCALPFSTTLCFVLFYLIYCILFFRNLGFLHEFRDISRYLVLLSGSL